MSEKYTYGHEKVSYESKISGVKGIFKSVASKYDLMNDLMSGALHRLWKARLVTKVAPYPGMVHLDLAGGTGDIAFRLQRHAAHMRPAMQLIVGDLSYEMLNEGRDRAINTGCHRDVTWVQLNGETLPFPSGTFDCITISFGLRNVAKIQEALCQMYRVLKPGGRLFIMEFSTPLPGIAPISRFYNSHILPALGDLIAGDRASYQYLADSIATFPDQTTLQGMVVKAGFAHASFENLAGGIVAIHQGVHL